ncbi:hypothetical protein [Nonomuraea sediminis]|uniref:hypothetical protein n=1 Tax=Nonomuraea sediminis TaxID=2835864 RepID=UPI001BDC77AA|nr:hypothetical protein [Nonomuraea sediminis]
MTSASAQHGVGPNQNLQLLLDTLGWRPETLARKVNAALARVSESRRVHEKTPYRWLHHGQVPHAPVPDVVVEVLSEAIGEPVAFNHVWPAYCASRAPSLLPANHRLDVAWDGAGLLRLLKEWSHGMLTRRRFTVISGVLLTRPAWQWLDYPPPTMASAQGMGKVSDAVVSLIEEIVTKAQQLDDQQGGAATTFVADQFNCVSRLLRTARYDAPTGRRLCAALAQLAQTAGFMAHESQRDGEAQRWYLAGLHAAQAADDRALASSILGLMSNQATALGKINDALQLASAAQEACTEAPTAVQALIAARSGLAFSAAGDLTSFRRARDHALTMLNRAHEQTDRTPRWAHYVDRTELDAIAGRSLVTLARRIPARQTQLLRDAEILLRDRALVDSTSPYQRSALLHGAWLSLAYTQAGHLDQAVTMGRRTLGRLSTVTSVRCVDLLRRLRDDLRPSAHRTPAVGDLVADLNRVVNHG